MLKLYDGYANPGRVRTRFSIDWYCPHCDSPNVDRDPEDTRELHWCDGGPATEDDMRNWLCSECGERSAGRDMKAEYQNLPLTPEEELEERVRFELPTIDLVERISAVMAADTKKDGEE